MSNRSIYSLLLIFFLLACQGPLPDNHSTPASSTPAILPGRITSTPKTTQREEPCCSVRLHPEEPLYVGDQVSFEVIAPSPEPYLNQSITITLTAPQTLIGSTSFQPYGFDRRPQATLLWAWDTHTLIAGDYKLNFSIPTLGQEWSQTVTLLPRSALPLSEQNAHWQTLPIDCCNIHFITNTAAHRDIEEIAEIVEQKYRITQEQIPYNPKEKLSIVVIPRVIGNGGFANAEINVSYLDRNYTANDFATILHHEMVHIFDQLAQPDARPSLFVEGIAVYLSGGHYFPEPLLPRAAEVVRLKKYLPLESIANDFYNAQHELAYLEAGALMEYLTLRWGWQRVWETYLEMTLRKDESHLQAIDRALRAKLGISFQQLEDDYLTTLESLEENLQFAWDIETMELYYETLRSYQQQLDPAAYYRTAWMLDAAQMRQKGIIADYFRHPRRAENLVIELLLNEAGRARRANEYNRFREINEAITSTLDYFKGNATNPFLGNVLANNALQVVQILTTNGYEPQTWILSYKRAEVWVTQGTPHLRLVVLENQNGKWRIISGASAATDDLIQWTQ